MPRRRPASRAGDRTCRATCCRRRCRRTGFRCCRCRCQNPLQPNTPGQVLSRLKRGAVLQPDGTSKVHTATGEVLLSLGEPAALRRGGAARGRADHASAPPGALDRRVHLAVDGVSEPGRPGRGRERAGVRSAAGTARNAGGVAAEFRCVVNFQHPTLNSQGVRCGPWGWKLGIGSWELTISSSAHLLTLRPRASSSIGCGSAELIRLTYFLKDSGAAELLRPACARPM